ncbi:Protein of unknown function DUF43 [Paraburkholderia steynii]|uniref:N(4)-bis(aminopropyl)spermidine synthase C-terminal domain-containing protein n=1 Tax=Paraburkholderia steynii TaxID=1245441 RepID=A0A7Z7FGW7_9BURK|nr:bis-aminopropyl spermidine synthase family protein [Paraburkholderia steynii]SDH78112.1 Protein of unknown function DUF43 [Paraburkholderia steynii]
MNFDLRNAINAISDVVQNRPPPLREFDQIYMKVADMVVQAEYVARVFDGKDVVFVGDGDGIALSAAHLKAQDVISYGPKSITLLDFDERIVQSFRRFGEKLRDRVQISAHLYNVADPLPDEPTIFATVRHKIFAQAPWSFRCVRSMLKMRESLFQFLPISVIVGNFFHFRELNRQEESIARLAVGRMRDH